MGSELIQDGWLQLLARLALGSLLMAAGASKLRHRGHFRGSLEQLGLSGRPAVRWAAGWVPRLETLLGALLLIGLHTRPAAMAAAGLLILFLGVVGFAVARRLAVEFHCAPGLGCRASGWTVARNLLFCGLAVYCALGGGDRLCADSWLRELPAPTTAAWDAIPAFGLAFFLLTVGMLLPQTVALAGRWRRAEGR
jgi:uncharacterized membrane protein YphA (DoxX/SURF4 family)